MLTFTHDGKTYEGWDPVEALAAGVPAATVGRATKDWAILRARAYANSQRARLSAATKDKLAEYQLKEAIARDQSYASQAELDMLTDEATARGLDLAALLALIIVRADALRMAALTAGKLEAEVVAALEAVPEGAADIAAQIATIIETKQAEADTAYDAAYAAING